MNQGHSDDRKFLAWFTLALIGASLWIFKSYLHFIVVAGVLALATSHVYTALVEVLGSRKKGLIYRSREFTAALLLTCSFLIAIFTPLLYFISVSVAQAKTIDIAGIKETLLEMTDKSITFLNRLPFLQEPLNRLKTEGASLISGPAIETAISGVQGLVVGVGSLIVQVGWILLFYFLFNLYSRKILRFLAELFPMSYEHENYLYRECTGTVAVVFYGTLFNMVAQGLAFGLLMVGIGGYDAFYLGVLAGFCSVIPIVGSALVYIPVLALELLAGNLVHALIILVFAWVVMGFLIDNILRLVFIGFLKKIFGFEYTMNEILILLAILAGIATFGFWGLIIGPSVLALTLAAANLYSLEIRD